ncbi:sodium-coupled monocarboxylate transporter 2-like isoform X2 [Haemaphysalis longicornis]
MVKQAKTVSACLRHGNVLFQNAESLPCRKQIVTPVKWATLKVGMMPHIEHVVFGTLVALNLALGLYFSLRRKARSADTAAEVFLGGRALRAIPLAASVVASLFSSMGLVGMAGHFYAYGFHLMWNGLTTLFMAPIAAHLFLPVFYDLRITSVFEQSVGALSILAASLAIATVFEVPLLWCNILIGFGGTLYTAFGGLRGVVWTDCLQLLLILLGPGAVITKIVFDLKHSTSTPKHFATLDAGQYFGNTAFDITHDENVWGPLLGSSMACLYRLGLDQVVVQRYMACRTLSKARRTLFMGAGMLLIICIFSVAMTLTLIVWFQGCDPQLAGAIRRYDQILPFYVKHYLGQFKGFTGIFLAAVVCAATSTTSSIINSQAAVLYVDALSQLFPNIDSHLKLVTRTLAFFLGAVMTLYSCVCVYLGSITRVILMVKSAATGPFTGLLLLAVGFPFVHSKGAGTSTLLMLAFQMFILWQDVHYGPRAPRMPATLNDCPDNRTFIYGRKNNSSGALPKSDAPLFRLSPCWSCFFSTFATVFLGLAISLASGEHRQPKAHVKHLNKWFVRLWRKLGINESCQPVEVAMVGHPRAITTKPLLNEERERIRKP